MNVNIYLGPCQLVGSSSSIFLLLSSRKILLVIFSISFIAWTMTSFNKKIKHLPLIIFQFQLGKIWYVGIIYVNELKPKVLTLLDDPPPLDWGQNSFKPNLFSDLSAFFSLCNGHFSQTQSLP